MASIGIEPDEYNWTKMLVTIYSQSFYLDNAGTYSKSTKSTEYTRNKDVDAACLEDMFSKDMFEIRYITNCTFDDFIRDCVKVMDIDKETYKMYDCFLFAFLTFQNEDDERLHFYADRKEEGLKPLEAVIEEVKKQEVTWGKPKIFLVQADDIRLIEGTESKSSELEKKTVKIPQDADRLIIKSTIPQAIANNDKPSFLIQAFKRALDENTNKDDLLSLTTTISGNVAALIKDHKISSNMAVPLVTSTLTKLLKL